MIAEKTKTSHIVAGAFLLFVVLFFYSNRDIFRVRSSIDKSVDFLYKNQLSDGEIKTMMCAEPEMVHCLYESSPFITTFILEALHNTTGEKAREIKNKGISFLLHEKRDGGLWNVWTSKNPSRIVSDIDDTVTISTILKKNGITFEDNREAIRKNINNDGYFYTWFDKKAEENEIDCNVNANVMRYFQENNPLVCAYINNAIKRDVNCSIYSGDMLALYYYASRAYADGIICLGENRGVVVERLKKIVNQNKTFGNDLQNALAINSLMNFGYFGKEVRSGISSMIQRQALDGSWKMENFYSEGNYPAYYGSSELTTAISLEALNKFFDHMTKPVQSIVKFFDKLFLVKNTQSGSV